ncbi:TPA: LrgB family protein, partial [Pasteurella multocida]
MMNWSLYGYSFLTLLAFTVAVKISRHWKSILFNSFVLTVTLVVILLTIDISYDDYLQGNAPLN